MRPIRVLQYLPYYAPTLGYGGPPVVAFNLARGLVSKGHAVDVYTSDANDGKSRQPSRHSCIENVDVTYFPNLSNKLAWHFDRAFPLGLRKALKANLHKYDIVHIFGKIRGYMPALIERYLRKSKIPYVIDAYGAIPGNKGLFRNIIKPMYDTLFLRSLILNANGLFAQTEHEKSLYVKFGVPEAKTHLVPLPIDEAIIHEPPERGLFRKKHGINSSAQLILFVGRLHPTKGVDTLVEAFGKYLKKAANECLLVIVGKDQGCLSSIKKQISELNISERVLLLPHIYSDERFEAYVDSDIFSITPSHFEETSTASLEACACGTPVVVTKQADVPFLEEYGAGYCVEDNPSQIANAFDRIFKQRADGYDYREATTRLIKERFSLKTVTSRVENIYEEILLKR